MNSYSILNNHEFNFDFNLIKNFETKDLIK